MDTQVVSQDVSDAEYQPPAFDSKPTAQIRAYAELDDIIKSMFGLEVEGDLPQNLGPENIRYFETVEKVNAFYRDQSDEYLEVLVEHIDRALLLLSFAHNFGECRGPLGGDASMEHTLTECIHSHLDNWEHQFASMRYNNNNSYRWNDHLLEAIPDMAQVYAERIAQMESYFQSGEIAKAMAILEASKNEADESA